MESLENGMLSFDDMIMVSRDSFESDEPYDVIYSNITVVNALFSRQLFSNEISRGALLSYFVDFYLAQVNNGGFAQFVLNSRWNEEWIGFVRQGLQDMGAFQHLALFDEGAAIVEALGEDKLLLYFIDDYAAKKPVRNSLNVINERFFDLEETENLITLNADWLKRQPNFSVLSDDDLKAALDRRAAAVPNRSEREDAAQNQLPQYIKLIHELCERSGQKLERVAMGDPSLFYDGETVRRFISGVDDAGTPRKVVWFFVTDKGVHLMGEANGRAAMFENRTGFKIAEIDVSSE
ncbi:conserved hypothetical protein [Agrobacterium deltaense Zutra 3/1]|uniref:DNA mimic protein DMP19 C-terminal domain-containing protein n=1 Tax=Agrobacterium deltaense Zutra 3/1 TaxID=1183427 RepID=A0A1S7PGK2_9HYPH|nr:DMP19 family protein [Agrobacterium deltaense]CUX20901.1 conserved hypothetical protein [Agrobacterium deltaense Zutra 3/1]